MRQVRQLSLEGKGLPGSGGGRSRPEKGARSSTWHPPGESVSDAARIIEVFPSIQGEGIYVGMPHLFVRFWNCNMACHYCDTDYRGPYVEYSPGRLSSEVKRLISTEGPFHAVSLTGGEPLLWHRFLRRWLPWLKDEGQSAYLETNGTLPEALAELLPWLDIVAMDIKPPSATADRPQWAAHERFLRLAWEGLPASGADGPMRPSVFVKVVVTRDTEGPELEQAVQLVRSVDRSIPLVLQPVTPWGRVSEGPTQEQLARWVHMAGDVLADVRITPQVHRLLGVP